MTLIDLLALAPLPNAVLNVIAPELAPAASNPRDWTPAEALADQAGLSLDELYWLEER